MKIAIIGTGNVGLALANSFRKANHSVVIATRNPNSDFKNKDLILKSGLNFFETEKALSQSEVIVISTPAQAAIDIAKNFGDVSKKIIIDTMNSVGKPPEGFTNTTDAILANCNSVNIVKCFNTTGVENMANPNYNGVGIDMFVAGSSEKGKQIAKQLSIDIGFETCYDFGGNSTFQAIEQFAFAWINLAIIQKNGRDIAFKILKR